MGQKHVMVLANDTTYTFNLRREILMELVKQGYKVTIVSEVLKHQEALENLGCRLIDITAGRHGTNPLQDVALLLKYIKILRAEKPDVVLSYNIKPNVYGGMACRMTHTRYIPNITGLGTAVEYPGKMQKLTTKLYKWGTYGADCIFFQNSENLQFFTDKKMLSKKSKTRLLPGSGVALDQHPLMEYPKSETIDFLYVARILKEKGIDLYLEAAKYIHAKHPETVFHVCGGCDDKNYLEVLQQTEKEGYIRYHGEQKDMKPWFEKCACLVHPSYYPEGMSNVLLEAAASGRPVIATDRAGCRETVDDGVSGFVIPIKDQAALNEALDKFMAMSWDQHKEMGLNGRAKVEREFDRMIVVERYLEELDAVFRADRIW